MQVNLALNTAIKPQHSKGGGYIPTRKSAAFNNFNGSLRALLRQLNGFDMLYEGLAMHGKLLKRCCRTAQYWYKSRMARVPRDRSNFLILLRIHSLI